MWAIVTSAVYPLYVYIWQIYILCPLINTPHPEGVILSQPKKSVVGVVFDVDHDFEGPRAPKAHLDTAKEKVGSEKTHPLVRGRLPCRLRARPSRLSTAGCERLEWTLTEYVFTELFVN